MIIGLIVVIFLLFLVIWLGMGRAYNSILAYRTEGNFTEGLLGKVSLINAKSWMEEIALLLAGCCHLPVISEMIPVILRLKGMVQLVHAEHVEQREGKNLSV